MNGRQAELFLLDQVPMVDRALIAGAIDQAYRQASALVASEPILSVESFYPGRVISAAIDLALSKLVKSGQWKADFRWKSYAKPTGKYLELRTTHAVITASLVADPTTQPRDVRYRQFLRDTTQGVLAFPELIDQRNYQGVPHIVLVHGHKSPDFAHLAIPDANHAAGWIFRSKNLMEMPRVINPVEDQPPPEVEDTDYEAMLTLKDEIDRWRRDNDS